MKLAKSLCEFLRLNEAKEDIVVSECDPMKWGFQRVLILVDHFIFEQRSQICMFGAYTYKTNKHTLNIIINTKP